MVAPFLASLLELGSEVCLSYGGHELWTHVFSVENNRCQLALPVAAARRAQDEGWSPGGSCEVEVTHGTGVYHLTLHIESLTYRVDGALVNASLAEDVGRIQRRDAFRVQVLMNAQMRTGEESAQLHETLVRDLSQTGARISVSSSDSMPGLADVVSLRFESASFGSLHLNGQVRWVRELTNGLEYGLIFLGLERVQSETLQKYVWEFQLKQLQQGQGAS